MSRESRQLTGSRAAEAAGMEETTLSVHKGLERISLSTHRESAFADPTPCPAIPEQLAHDSRMCVGRSPHRLYPLLLFSQAQNIAAGEMAQRWSAALVIFGRRFDGRIFFSRVHFLCWLLCRFPFYPRVTAAAR